MTRGSLITLSDIQALAPDADVAHWLYEADTFTPGALNLIRDSLRTALEVIGDPDNEYDTSSHGWSEDCLLSGPWVLPTSVYGTVLGDYPGHTSGTFPWYGIVSGAAGVYAYYKEVEAFANESFVLRARGVVSTPTFGWTGDFDGTGWTRLSFACAIQPASAILTGGVVYVEIPDSSTILSVTDGSGGTWSYTTSSSGGYTRYTVDVSGSPRTGVHVNFVWDTGYSHANNAIFTVEHSYGTASLGGNALADNVYHLACGTDFRVMVNSGWQVADTYLWCEFDHGATEELYDESWCLMAKTLPVSSVEFNDWLRDGSAGGLAPQWMNPVQEYRPECPSAPMQRNDSTIKDSLTDATKPRFRLLPATPYHYPCYAVSGVWIARKGIADDHAPFKPDVATAAVTRDAVSVNVGRWAADDTFNTFETFSLAGNLTYVFHPLDKPWPVFENKAVVYSASPDSVTVTTQVTVAITLPVTDWRVTYPGQTSSFVDRNANGIEDFPATPDGVWTDVPPSTRNAAMSAAIYNDTAALIALLP